MLVLDSGAVTFFASQTTISSTVLQSLVAIYGLPRVPTVVVIECTANTAADANTNRFLKGCMLVERVPLLRARQAASLRRLAGRGSAVDALVVTMGQDGAVVTGDTEHLSALAGHARNTTVFTI